MPRHRAIALIVSIRQSMLEKIDERLPDDAQRTREAAAELERLMLDVRAGRLDSFELKSPSPMHVTVSTK
ncbi:hypothetical protein [Burkholderia sp. WAC0059]|uniref:hypothetical protein n=1 Tax=Burkholderia sp. WAC0059 TaxID=2066022 RepID=UPI002155A942|nr:hypothetical protein [Burkholderia sp. WAC0059]